MLQRSRPDSVIDLEVLVHVVGELVSVRIAGQGGPASVAAGTAEDDMNTNHVGGGGRSSLMHRVSLHSTGAVEVILQA
jgi:hypothetical protein